MAEQEESEMKSHKTRRGEAITVRSGYSHQVLQCDAKQINEKLRDDFH